MRGNHGERPRLGVVGGSIPAHAGQPVALARDPRGSEVYPRACGATRPGSSDMTTTRGLSPRMRGNRGPDVDVPAFRGSIPAHAGQPRHAGCSTQILRVYPRACGATLAGRDDRPWPRGLSPRMRGNPPWLALRASADRVYPRACGATRVSVNRTRLR